MRCLYYCTTPFQVLCAVNICKNNTVASSETDVKSDIIIVNIFNKAQEISEKLQTLGLFENIWIIAEEDVKTEINNKLIKGIYIFYDVIKPDRLLRKQFGLEDVSFLHSQYSIIISSIFSHPLANLRTINPDALFYMMDDGIGSYYGNIITKLRSGFYRKLLMARNHGREISIPDRILLYQPDFYKGEFDQQIDRIPPINSELSRLTYKIFNNGEDSTAYEESIIWLSQPTSDASGIRIVKDQASVMRAYKRETIVRLHPRDKDNPIYEGFTCDKSGDMWELRIGKIKMENKLLISFFSTAQFSPKLFYDYEPSIIFTYKMMDNKDERSMDTMVAELKKLYRDPSKIIVIDKWVQMEDYIANFLCDSNTR